MLCLEQRRSSHARSRSRSSLNRSRKMTDPTSSITSVSRDRLDEISQSLSVVPQGFNLNPKMVGQMGRRSKMGSGEVPIDWAFAEGLAFGSLLQEGTSVRLSGQDSGRGTFSQRHAVLYDTRTGRPWVPLEGLTRSGVRFEVFDSSLSEAAVLGFESWLCGDCGEYADACGKLSSETLSMARKS